MALPNDKISTSLVANTLGTSSRDVGTLCTHQAINKWSKWKPIRVNTNGEGITNQNLIDAKSGLEFKSFPTLDALINYYRTFDDNKYIFEYLKPRGLSFNEGYRLGDFRNYEHNAIQWYIFSGMRDNFFSSDSQIALNVQTEGINVAYNIDWVHAQLDDCYFGATVLTNGTLNNKRSAVSSVPFSNTAVSAYTATIPINTLQVGTYEYFGYAVRYQQGNPSVISEYIPLETGYLGRFQLLSSRLTINMTGQLIPNGIYYNVPWTLELKNLSTTAELLNNCIIELRYRNSSPGSALMQGEQRLNLGNIQVNALQTYTDSGTFNNSLNLLSSQGNGAYLYFQNSSDSSLNMMFPI